MMKLSSHGFIDLFAKMPEDSLGHGGDLGIFDVARPRQRDRKLSFDTARPVAQNENAIAEADRFAHIVSDEDDGLSGLAPNALKLVVKQVAGLRIESGEWFIHQQNVGLHGQGASQRHALLHATRKLMRMVFLELSETNEIQVVAGLRAPLFPVYAFLPQAKFNVLPGCEPRKESQFLEQEYAVGAGFFHFAAIKPDFSSRGVIEPSDEMKQCGLAAPGRSDDAQEFSRENFETNIFQSR
jgi:hypothetical protein